jgi:predicted DNA-binding protein with PD1-like motif
MTFKPSGQKFLIRLFKGEEIISTLTKFCEEQNIQSAWISGLGGSTQITLGYYNLAEKSYHWKDFSGDLEIVSLTGNVSVHDSKPFLHIHTTISNEELQCFGGHLKSGIVAATLEIVLEKLDSSIERKMDDEVGLNLLDLQSE